MRERLEEVVGLTVVQGRGEEGTPCLRVWGAGALSALHQAPPVEAVVEVATGGTTCTLVSYRREALHTATFPTNQVEGLAAYLETRLCRSPYSLCRGCSEEEVVGVASPSMSHTLVERGLARGSIVYRSRRCQLVLEQNQVEQVVEEVAGEQVGEVEQLREVGLERCQPCSSLLPSPSPQLLACTFHGCGRTFRREKPFRRHMDNHGTTPITAQEANTKGHPEVVVEPLEEDKALEAESEEGVDEHIEEKLLQGREKESRILTCSYCSATYQYDKAFQKHLKSHTEGSDKYRCDTCDQVFPTNNEHTEHWDREHGNLVCSQCKAVFNSKKTLERHKKNTHGNLQDQCHLCGKNVKRTSMNNHVKMVHQGEEMRKHLCNICGKGYKTKTDLDRHYTKHTGEKANLEI